MPKRIALPCSFVAICVNFGCAQTLQPTVLVPSTVLKDGTKESLVAVASVRDESGEWLRIKKELGDEEGKNRRTSEFFSRNIPAGAPRKVTITIQKEDGLYEFTGKLTIMNVDSDEDQVPVYLGEAALVPFCDWRGRAEAWRGDSQIAVMVLTPVEAVTEPKKRCLWLTAVKDK